MKNLIVFFLIFLTLFSCKTVQLTDGTYITKRQERKIYEKVFNDTFGQMTEEEVKLFEDVSFSVDSTLVDSPESTERIITVYTDTSYVETPSLTEYKELIYSQGDSVIINDMEMIIIDSISYLNIGKTTWYNCKAVTVYR